MKVGEYTGFRTAWFCVACDGELSNWAVLCSHGRCPLCGHKHDSAVTIVETYERAYRLECIAPWWKFWAAKTRRVYLDDSPERAS